MRVGINAKEIESVRIHSIELSDVFADVAVVVSNLKISI